MNSRKDNAQALPLLDTIETSQNCNFALKPFNIKGSEDFFAEKKSEDNSFQLQESDLFGDTPVSDSEFIDIEEWERQCNRVSQELANDFETERLFEEQENNSEAIKSAEYYKHLTDELAGLLIYQDSILQDRAEKMLYCGTYFETYEDKVVAANFCRQRICPTCQRRRALRTCAETAKMQQYLSEKKYKYLHLVLTVPNCTSDELCDTIDLLYKASSALFKHKEVKNKFKGVMRCLEVTYNAKRRIYTSDSSLVGDCFHPHLHCLVCVSRSYGSGKNYLSRSRLADLWMASCNSRRVLDVFVSAIKEGDDKALAEIAKYCVKPLELSCPASERCEVLETIYSALHGRRLVQMYGVFREAAKALRINCDDVLDELDKLDEKKIKRYNYNRFSRRFELYQPD